MSTSIPSEHTGPQFVPQATVDAPPDPVKPPRTRVDSIDLLRGIVMVIMMLDHTRDFVHSGALLFDPTDLTQTTTAIFLTRWITHFCAPVFVFLAGTGAYLQSARGKSKRELSRFLVTRGFWLVLLEFTVVRFGATFNLDPSFLGMMQVIWAIGISMIVLAALIHLPLRVIAAFGIGMIAVHNLLDRFHVQGWHGPDTPVPGFWAKLFIILHQPFEPFPVFSARGPVVFVLYPLIPWIGVMATGYVFGSLYEVRVERRRKLLLIMGCGATALFIILRLINLYGDPSPWARQTTVTFTVLSFLNTTKYPPSLLFLLMTLGPALLALAWFEVVRDGQTPPTRPLWRRLRDFFITFGRVPLFFYLLQWFTAHLIAVFVHFVAGKPWRCAGPSGSWAGRCPSPGGDGTVPGARTG